MEEYNNFEHGKDGKEGLTSQKTDSTQQIETQPINFNHIEITQMQVFFRKTTLNTSAKSIKI